MWRLFFLPFSDDRLVLICLLKFWEDPWATQTPWGWHNQSWCMEEWSICLTFPFNSLRTQLFLRRSLPIRFSATSWIDQFLLASLIFWCCSEFWLSWIGLGCLNFCNRLDGCYENSLILLESCPQYAADFPSNQYVQNCHSSSFSESMFHLRYLHMLLIIFFFLFAIWAYNNSGSIIHLSDPKFRLDPW